MPSISIYPFDLNASMSSNLSDWEYHAVTPLARNLIIPQRGAFYEHSLQVKVKRDTDEDYVLLDEQDFKSSDLDVELTQKSGLAVYRSILVKPAAQHVHCAIRYRYTGVSTDVRTMVQSFNQLVGQSNVVAWDNVSAKPDGYPPNLNHDHDVQDFHDQHFFSNKINEIASAILIGDKSQHDLLYSRLEDTVSQARQEMFSLIDSASENGLAQVLNVTSLARAKLNAFDQNKALILQDQSDTDRDLDLIATFNDNVAEYVDNPIASAALLKLDRLFLMGDPKGLSIPNRIPGFSFWLDATDSTVRVTNAGASVACKASNRTYGATNAYFEKRTNDDGVSFLRVKPRAVLEQTRGAPIRLRSGYTVIAVYAGTSEECIGVKLLAGANGQYLKLKDEDNRAFVFGEQSALLQCAKNTAHPTSVNLAAMVLDESSELGSEFVSSKLNDTNTYPKGYHPSNQVGQIDITATQLFDANTDAQSGIDLYHLMIYTRKLKLHEIEAICSWISARINVSVNVIGNGSFYHPTAVYTSDYTLNAEVTPNASYSQTTAQFNEVFAQHTLLDQIEWIVKRRLAVKGDSTTLAFWKQGVRVDPYCRYQFDLDIVFAQQAPPVIHIEVNGVTKKIYDCAQSSSSRVRITTSFESNSSNADIRLYNKYTGAQLSAFMVEKVSCRRSLIA